MILLGASSGLSAGGIHPEQAAIVAGNFLMTNGGDCFSMKTFGIEKIYTLSEDDTPLIHVVDLSGDNGMVFISADDRVSPVLGYTGRGDWAGRAWPPQLETLLRQYQEQLAGVIRSGRLPSEAVRAQWKALLDPGDSYPKTTLGVGPLLQTTWDQGELYNDSCPEDPDAWFNGRVPTGCVATAIAQIMKYHAYPAQGAGSHTYVHPSYGPLSAHFGATAYNWTAMPAQLVSPNPPVAQLMFHCGVGTEMNYGPYASGAYSDKAVQALVHFFLYSSGTRLVLRSNYSDPAWISLMKAELDNDRVCYYAAYGDVGHAFVLDGYDNNDFFHFNWGWSGWYDGYFNISNLDPGGNVFNDYHEAIIGIEPGLPQSCQGMHLLDALYGNFNDGSYSANYQNNAACQWLIQPLNNPVSIELRFLTFQVETGNDQLKVYDGNNTSAPLLGIFSGNTLPPVITSSGGSLFVEFITNGTVAMQGWSASYEANYCFPEDTLTAPSGILSDGSGSWEYRNHTDCKWLIQQPGNVNIALIFNLFETEYDFDFVDVYDGATTADPLLGHFSGDTLPPPLLSTGNAMLLHFTSDGGLTGQGWEAGYTTSVGVPAGHEGDALFLFPNPASDRLAVVFPSAGSNIRYQIRVFDYTGRIVLEQQAPVVSNNVIINTSALLPGYYFLRLSGADKIAAAAFLVR